MLTGAPALATAATTASGVASYPITAALGTLAAGNYDFSFVAGALAVTHAPLTVTADNKSRAYGAADPAFTATLTGFVNGDTAAVVSGAAAFSTTATGTSPAGTYPITPALGTLTATNYAFTTFTNGTLTVGQTGQTITFGALTSKTYGDAAFSVSATASSSLTPTFSIASGPATISGSTVTITGAGTVVVRASQAGDTTYAPAEPVDRSFTVALKTLTVTADAQTRLYGAANPTLTATITGFVNSETAAVLSGSAALSTTATATSTVGDYAITAAIGGLTATNYDFSFTAGTLTVAKAALTVSADAKTRSYGDANPALTATITGYVNSDTSAVVSGTPTLTTGATPTSSVGGYAITTAVGSLTATNYSFSLVNGTLTVGKAPITVTADAKTKVYGAANPPLTATITGFKNGETAAVLTGAPALATAATTASGVNSYPITTAIGTLASGNYSFTFVDGSLAVTKAPLTVTADNKNRVYGVADPAFTATLTGFVNSDTSAVITGAAAFSTTATGTSPAGAYPITPAVGTLAATNYAFTTFVAGTLTVGQVSQTIAFGALADKTFGDPAFTVSATASSGLTPTFSIVSGQASISGNTVTVTGLGTVVVRVAQAGDANFTAAVPVDRSFTVVAAATAAAVNLGGLSAIYDGTPKSVTVSTSPADLAYTLTYAGSTTAPTNAGSYAVVATVTSANATGTASGTLVIAQATQTVTFGALPAVVTVGSPITVSATASSGLPVTLALVSGNAALTGATLTLNDTSPAVLRASQAGDANRAAASADVTLVAGKQTQTITFVALANVTTVSGPVPLTASASSGLPVAFTLVSGPATLSGSTVSLSGIAGTVVVRATQAGNALFSAAPSVDRTFTVTNATAAPIIVQAPASRTLNVGQSVTLAVAALGEGTLIYQWLKDGSPLAGANSASLALANVTAAQAGLYRVDVTNAGGTTRSTAATLTVTDTPVAPVITIQPAPQTAQTGGTATFTVVATGNPAPVYQWQKNGAPISGANAATLTLANVQSVDAAGYDVVVSNAAGRVNSSFVSLTVNAVATAPVITRQPSNDTALVGETVVLSVAASGAPAPAYQWQKDGVALSGATAATLTLPSVTKAQVGGYAVVVSNTVGSVTSRTAALRVLGRSYAGTYFGTLSGGGTFALYIRDDNTGVFLGFTAGATTAYLSRDLSVDDEGRFTFTSSAATATSAPVITGERSMLSREPSASVASELVVTGTISPSGTLSGTAGGLTLGATKSVEGATQSVAGFYVASASGSSAQTLTIVSPSGQALVLVQTATGVDAGLGSVSATGAIAVTTAAGQTVIASVSSATESVSSTVTDKQGKVTTFAGISDNAAVLAEQRLFSLSTRVRAGTGERVGIAGFVISGEESKTVLIRAVGPTLAAFGVDGILAAPRLDLYRGSTVIAANTGWSRAANAAEIAVAATRSGAFALAAGSADSAVLVTLAPGAYTAVVSSASGGAGVALVEVYDLSGAATGQRLISLSTRAVAGTAGDMLIAGVVVNGTAPKRVLIRAAGPGLAAFGLNGVLPRPKLELFSGANVIAQNTGWSTSADAAGIAQAAGQVGAFAFAPGSEDSALLVNLAPGAYTAQVSGVAGTTGVALVEIYEVP